MPNYRRNFVPGGCYFFTVAMQNRRNDLPLRNIETLRESVRRIKQLHPFDIDAWVVLPEHLHCIWTLPPGDADYSLRWRLIKPLFCKQIPATECLTSTQRHRHERGIWQRR